MIYSFEKHKAIIKLQLQNLPFSVHFSFDLWTSTNGLAIIGIIGHWISNDGIVQYGLLSMKKIEGAHSGDNQAALVMNMLTEYDILNKIGYFTLDNASSNDSALRILAQDLKGLGISFNWKEKRLRCFGHIINLIVKALLYGANTNTIPINDPDSSDLELSPEEL